MVTAGALLLGLATPVAAQHAAGGAGWNPNTGIYEMVFPVDEPHSYRDTWGACRDGCNRRHEGTDIFAAKMTLVFAAAAGTVGWMRDSQGDCCAMALEHDDGWVTWYIHLNNDTPGTDDGQGWGFAPGITSGVHVDAGEWIGWVGDSGNAESTSPHLHFELHRPNGMKINPFPHLVASEQPAGAVPGLVSFTSYRVDDGPTHDGTGDDSRGNNDSAVQCGEIVEIYVTARNEGNILLSGLSGAFSESDPYVRLLYNINSPYPDLAPGASAENLSDWDIKIDRDTPIGYVFTATVAFSLLDPVELSLHPIDSVVDVEIPIECSAPEVIGFSPADAAVDVAVGSDIRVTFSKAVAAGTVTADTFTVDNGGPVAGTVTVAGNRKSATFNPDVDLQYQTAYTVTATAGIQDKAGNPLVPDSATFTTTEPDTTSPEVVNVTPADGALDLPVGGDVTVTFSEPIEPATLNSGSFGLVNGGAVPGSLVAATDALSATFTPDGPLAYETPYQVSVTGDVTDTSGNALAPFASSFTTGRAPLDPGIPVFESYRVDDGPSHDGTGNDSRGNNDGLAQCGETIELYVTLVNGGDVALTGVSALLIESDPYVSLLYNASASYPDIGPGTPRENPRDWDLLISPDAPGGHQFAFILRVGADGGGWWDIDVTVPLDCGDPPAPEDPGLPVLVGVRVDDGPAHDGTGNDSEGNDDGVAQCGETIEVYVRIGNAGAVTLTGVSGLLLESDPHATLLYNTSAAYPDLAGGGGAENPRDWDLRLAEGTPDGHQLAFTVRVTDDGGGSWDIDVVVPIACP